MHPPQGPRVNIDLEMRRVDWVVQHLGVAKQPPEVLWLLGDQTLNKIFFYHTYISFLLGIGLLKATPQIFQKAHRRKEKKKKENSGYCAGLNRIFSEK